MTRRRPSFLLPPAFLALAFLVGLPPVARAVDITVPTDQPTLAAALGVAEPNDTILLEAGTYAEADLTVGAGLAGLTVRSVSGDPATVTLDASGGTHALTNLAPAVTLRGMTVSGAMGTGVVAAGNASMVLLDCVIEDCGAGGAAIEQVEAWGCVFRNNASADSSRAGGLTAVSALVQDCEFRENDGVEGGAIRVVSSHLAVDGSTFSGNIATEDGGAIFLLNASYDLAACLFEGNQASTVGGAIYAENGDALGEHRVEDSRFLDNGANLLGGAVHVRNLPPGKVAEFHGVVFSGHHIIGAGGALSVRECAAAVEASTFTANSASQGGAVHVADGSLELVTTLIAFNSGGGAVICEGVSSATASCTDIHHNRQSPFGSTFADWIGCLSGQQSVSDNLAVDPEFCSFTPEIDGNFGLQSDSPCLGGVCGRVGALGAGCDLVPVEATTWGALKRRYD